MSWLGDLASEFDPTTKGGLLNIATGGMAKLGGFDDLADGLGKAKKIDGAGLKGEQDVAARARSDYEDWLSRWSGMTAPGGAATKRSAELGDIYTGEVDRGMYDAGTRTAANYARRGMADSGYAAAAQQGVIQKAAADRVTAREKAWQDALRENQSLLAGELPAMSTSYGFQFKPYEDQIRMAMLQAQLDSQAQSDLLGGVISLGGLTALGGGSGAGAAAAPIGSSEAPWYMGGGWDASY